MKLVKLFIAPLAAVLIWFFFQQGTKESLMAGVVAWMALWWLTEAVELSITALLPIILLPALGIMDAKETASQYMDPVIFLFIGGFLIAIAIEKWNLHKRIALKILLLFGTNPSGILLGVMLSAFVISMWISNTATVMILIASVLALISQTENFLPEENRKRFATALLLGLAYSASIGGMATPVGTPTNMIFLSFWAKEFPLEPEITFITWLKMAFPVSLSLMVVAFLLLKFMFLKNTSRLFIEKKIFREQHLRLGAMSYEEKAVTVVFCITVLLWFFRTEISFGSFAIPGWNSLFGNPKFIHDGMVAALMASLLFLIPSKKGKTLMTVEDFRKMPFEIVILFGGGFAMAAGFEASGLGNWLAGKIILQSSVFVFLLLLCALVVIMSEFASNVATIQLFLPVLVSLLPSLPMHPIALLFPVTLAASLGFMLPVATAPNTIVYGSRQMKTSEMMNAGFWLDIAGVLLIVIFIYVFLF